MREAVRRHFAYPPGTAFAAVPTSLAGLAVAGLALAHGGWKLSLPVLGLLTAATFAEAFPVPIEGVAAGTTSFSTVFIATTATEYGWARAAIVGGLAIGLAEAPKRLRGLTIAYNVGLFALAGAAAGVAGHTLPHAYRIGLASSSTFYVVDVALLAWVVSRDRGDNYPAVARRFFGSTFVPFVVIASLTIVAVRLFDAAPAWTLTLGPPLAALILYQRRLAGTVERQRELDRLKDEFISTTSHELRTPLTSIYGSAVTLDERTVDTGTRDQLIRIIRSEAARLTTLVDDVLWTNRITSRRVMKNIQRCDPGEAIREVVAAVSAGAPPNVRVVDGGSEASTVRADPAHLHRILLNLADNAVKYSPDGGTVTIVARNQNGAVRFEVRDEGLGVPRDRREWVFEKFTRLDPGMTRGIGGTGLGLFICKKLVDEMGGRIWVEPNRVATANGSNGSVFVFELPAN